MERVSRKSNLGSKKEIMREKEKDRSGVRQPGSHPPSRHGVGYTE